MGLGDVCEQSFNRRRGEGSRSGQPGLHLKRHGQGSITWCLLNQYRQKMWRALTFSIFLMKMLLGTALNSVLVIPN